MSMPVRFAGQNSGRAGRVSTSRRFKRPLALAFAQAMFRAIGVTTLALSSLFVTTVQAADARVERLAHSVTIYRDSYGVPHVYGPTDASCVFGYAYAQAEEDRKSTRLNSSHVRISYAVFCLKKKNVLVGITS